MASETLEDYVQKLRSMNLEKISSIKLADDISKKLKTFYYSLEDSTGHSFRLRAEYHNACDWGYLPGHDFFKNMVTSSVRDIFIQAICALIEAYRARNINGYELYVIDCDKASGTLLNKPTSELSLEKVMYHKYTQYDIDLTVPISYGVPSHEHVLFVAKELTKDTVLCQKFLAGQTEKLVEINQMNMRLRKIETEGWIVGSRRSSVLQFKGGDMKTLISNFTVLLFNVRVNVDSTLVDAMFDDKHVVPHCIPVDIAIFKSMPENILEDILLKTKNERNDLIVRLGKLNKEQSKTLAHSTVLARLLQRLIKEINTPIGKRVYGSRVNQEAHIWSALNRLAAAVATLHSRRLALGAPVLTNVRQHD
jgi:hypothetical protein